LEARLESLEVATTGRGAWEVLLIPQSLERGREEWQNDQELAARLAECMSRLPPKAVDDALEAAQTVP
jgi:hypothetical protein